MGDRLIRWRVAGAVLTALLALGVFAAAPEARAAHSRHLAQTGDLQAHHATAHERAAERRRILKAGRWARHWKFRHHQLVFDQPHQGARHAGLKPVPAVPDRRPHSAVLIRPLARGQTRSLFIAAADMRPLGQASLVSPLLVATQPTPAASPDQAAAAPAVDLATQLGQLTVAVAEVMKGARLDVAPLISSGGQGKVVLTLPPDLYAALQAKSAQVGLGGAARKTFITARLAGQGYAVTPAEHQTARLMPGEPTVFSWDVKSSPTPGGLLTADLTGSLQGEGDDKTFALGAVTAQIVAGGRPAPPPAPITAPAASPPKLNLKLPDFSGLHLSAIRPPDLSRLHLRALAIPGHPSVAVPGLGQVASEKVVAAAIAALALILLIAIVRSAGARRERAERRRRFHSFEAASFGDEHP